MTTYTSIPNGDVDQDSPVTQPLLTALRDNTISIAENDSSVPTALRPYVELGSIATTSGTSWTFSSLDLTPFNFIMLWLDGFAVTVGTGESIHLNAGVFNWQIGTTNTGASTRPVFIQLVLALDSGMELSAQDLSSTGTNAKDSGVRRSTTSITIAASGRTGTAGTIKLYGIK